MVKLKNGKIIEVPYYLTVMEGGITYDNTAMRFFISDKKEEVKLRSITIKNNFLTPLAILNVTLPNSVQKYFQVVNFKKVILKPGEEKSIFSLKTKFATNSALKLNINSNILLKTNISNLHLSLLSYSGKLELVNLFFLLSNWRNLNRFFSAFTLC